MIVIIHFCLVNNFDIIADGFLWSIENSFIERHYGRTCIYTLLNFLFFFILLLCQSGSEVEQLTRNEQVLGSIPSFGFNQKHDGFC
jgi:hypothetical protein